MLNQLEKKVCKRVIALQDEPIEVSSKLVAIDTSDPPGENYDACAKAIKLEGVNLAGTPSFFFVPDEENDGPGNLDMAHQADEYVEIRQLVIAAQVYALTAMRLIGVPQ